MNAADIIELEDFPRMVRWATSSSIHFPYYSIKTFQDLVHEVRVSIFISMTGKPDNGLKATTIIKNHTKWVLCNEARRSKYMKNSTVSIDNIEIINWRNKLSVESKDLYETVMGSDFLSPKEKRMLDAHLNGDFLKDLSAKFNLSQERCRVINLRSLKLIKRLLK